MKANLLKVSIRQGAIYIPKESIIAKNKVLSKDSLVFIANIRKLGYTVSEDLLKVLNYQTADNKLIIFDLLREICGSNLNWAPLVKGWDTPTGESRIDHIITFFVNTLKINKGTRLQCGHMIPENTFPLDRYNGCPFCGTPFQFGKIENENQGSKLKVLDLWTEDQLNQFFKDLLESKTALDATQVDSLKILISERALPEANINMKETLMLVIDSFVKKGEPEKAESLFSTPNDILRYLWYKKTGFLQIVEPKTIIKRSSKNNENFNPLLDQSEKEAISTKESLKLKYNRTDCRMVATWMNNLNIDAEKACEMMHSKRGIWVRFIRALRFAEYAKKEDFKKLNILMDLFYNQSYNVWQADFEQNKLKRDAEKTFDLLKQRPGLFARSLFSTMLWFGTEDTLSAFSEVLDKLPARLIFTLDMYAENYFDPNTKRSVKPLGGTSKVIGANKMLELYTDEQLKEMVTKVKELGLMVIFNRFSQQPTTSKTMYIDPMLFNIPLSIGDRSETIQDSSCALMGTRFSVEGNAVRLFLQWGKGLNAQHLDMDLSCHIAYEERTDVCSYYNLATTGAKHSGDIRSIPDQIGTAEYIELNLDKLVKAKAKYVVFTCNAYSCGSLSPNLVVGWMNSANPMKISEITGVAYDPSCVQHQVRVSQGLTKGLVFGVFDLSTREIIWLEMPFGGQNVANMNAKNLEAFVNKLKSKISIGQLLSIKAKAQNIRLKSNIKADEIYTLQWAFNTAAVTKLLID